MKFRKFVVYSSFALSTFALITLLHNQKYSSAKFEQQQETITLLEDEIDSLQQENLQLKNQLENTTVNDLLSNTIKELTEEAKQNNISLSFDIGKVSISVYDKGKTGKLSDGFYTNLNQVMILADIKTISLYDLGNEIDFSKVNLTAVKNLHLYKCSEDLDCSFFTQKYDHLSFYVVPTQLVINIVDNCDCSDATISCSNIKDVLNEHEQTFTDIDAFANYLVENNVSMKALDISQWSYCSDNDFLTMETIDTLSHVNTERLFIISEGDESHINLNLTLNNNIQEFYIALPSYVDSWVFGIGVRQLGNVEISSENPNLNIAMQYGYINEQTHFKLPTSSTVQLLDTAHNDMTPFYDLSNVKGLEYTIRFDSIISIPVYADEFTITYSADTDNFDGFMDEFTEKMNEYWSTSIFELIKK